MDKREFLKLTALAGSGVVLSPNSYSIIKNGYDEAFVLPDLAYAYDALVPYIDSETMKIHHSKHFQGYTNKLNNAIAGTKFEGLAIEKILGQIKESDTGIRNNGGGYYNHKLFFQSLSPKAAAAPDGKLLEAVNRDFGSIDNLKEKFSAAALGVFGSGWAWLIADAQGKLSITATPNQDNPLMPFVSEQGLPIMGIDVWEHAYYLAYQNKRKDYVKAFWKVLDWKFVQSQYQG